MIIEVTRKRQLNEVKLIIQKERKKKVTGVLKLDYMNFAHLKNAGNYFP